jgi:hypothetical protein
LVAMPRGCSHAAPPPSRFREDVSKVNHMRQIHHSQSGSQNGQTPRDIGNDFDFNVCGAAPAARLLRRDLQKMEAQGSCDSQIDIIYLASTVFLALRSSAPARH